VMMMMMIMIRNIYEIFDLNRIQPYDHVC
jgi:hypothetical protein